MSKNVCELAKKEGLSYDASCPYCVEANIRESSVRLDAKATRLDETIRELKILRRLILRDSSVLASDVAELIDELPDPCGPGVVEECERILVQQLEATSNGVPDRWNRAMRAALRRARELWGLEPLKELAEPL